MEDVSVIHPRLKDHPNIFFAALMDGHGGKKSNQNDKRIGCATASFVASRIGENLHDALQQRDLTTFEDVLRYTFIYTDVECRLQNLMASGCTCASIAIVYDEKTNERVVYAANIGDSRVLYYSNGIVSRLSYVIEFIQNYQQDHKAEDKQEIARIIMSGGMVINKRVMGLLAVTRSFGDHSIKEFVISEPYIQSRKIIDDHSFIVLACDGVFDVLSDEETCNIVLQSIQNVIIDIKKNNSYSEKIEISYRQATPESEILNFNLALDSKVSSKVKIEEDVSNSILSSTLTDEDKEKFTNVLSDIILKLEGQ